VPNAGEIELSLVRTFPGQVGVMLTGSIADRVVADVGLSRPEAQIRDLDFVLDQLGGRAELTLSREELTIADGDIVFVFGNVEELFADPLWTALDAVQRGNVYEVGYYWYVEGLISAHDMLDDLFEHIAGVSSTLQNPFEGGITLND
jgi:iron complex transport system substrate-binding protein